MRGPTVRAVVAGAILLVASCAALFASVRSADAAPPVGNGKIVFASSRDTGPGAVNPEGDKELFTRDPDGTQIAFEREMPPADPDSFSRPPSDVYKMDTDGTGADTSDGTSADTSEGTSEATPLTGDRIGAEPQPGRGAQRGPVRSPAGSPARSPAGSPAGRFIAFSTNRGGGRDEIYGWAPKAAARPTSPEGPPATPTPSGHPADDG